MSTIARSSIAPALAPGAAPRLRLVSERVEEAAPVVDELAVRRQAEEGALVRRVQAGDIDAFDALVRRHLPRAQAVAWRVMRHREDAEDLVQEAFMRALDRIATFDATRPFAPWLCRIIVTQGYNARAAASRRPAGELDAALRAGAAGDGPDRLVERAEVRARFAAALTRLPEKQRLIVELADVEGFGGAELAEMLDMPAGTVRWHLHQARQALRDALAPLRD